MFSSCKQFIFPLTTFLLALLGTSSLLANDRREDYGFSTGDVNGKPVAVEASDRSTVVCFLGTECPMAKLYSLRIQTLSEQFESVRFIGVFSNRQDSLQDIRDFQKRHQLSYPLVRDLNNRIADLYRAQRTPEVFLINGNLEAVYRGRIDDQYQPGTSKPSPTRADLQLAIEQLLDGQAIEVAKTRATGCLIGRVVDSKTDGDAAVTYANQISRILNHHCYQCHREGEIGPMAFEDYDEVVGWAEMILETIEENRMPPWHADDKHAVFSNERRMTSAEKELIRDWVNSGAPLGDQADLPPKPDLPAATDWRLLKNPDLVIPMREKAFQVPATGTVDYQYFVVDPKFETDRWIIGAEVMPGDRSVLHHSIVFVRPPDGAEFQGVGWIAAFVPGQSYPAIDPKYGRRIPAGSKLVFQQHYTPNGKVTADLTKLGLVFGDPKEIEEEVFNLLAMNQDFLIPPNEPNHSVKGRFRFLPRRARLLGFAPHMHYRGKSFQLSVVTQDQQKQVLLNVPRYDFNWQHQYLLQEPIPLADIEQLNFLASFDNSDDNPFNPDPNQTVAWGDQTWEEMAVAFATIAVPRTTGAPSADQLSKTELAKRRAEMERLEQKVNNFVDDYLERFDRNASGAVERDEMPEAVKKFGVYEIDVNRDGIFSREELVEAAAWRFRQR